MHENNNLERFITAQEPIYENVVRELTHGKKTSHWMWYIFPQIVGLGMSSINVEFSIKTLEEARRYYSHRILGHRLRQCIELLLKIDGLTATEIFGEPDDKKLKSSMTLFTAVIPEDELFRDILLKYFKGRKCQRTITLLHQIWIPADRQYARAIHSNCAQGYPAVCENCA